MTRRFHLISVFAVVLVGTAAYFNAVSHPFVWNDIPHIVENELIHSWKHVWVLWTQSTEAGIDGTSFYRPLTMMSFLLNHQLGGSVWVYHATNILLHIGVALALFWMVVTVFDKAFVGAFTAMLFVSHPAHVQAVTYISGRADLLAALFMLLSYGHYVKFTEDQRNPQLVWSMVFFVLALFSKEYALILPGLFLVYHNAFWKPLDFKAWVTSLFVATAFGCLRVTGLLGDPLFQSMANNSIWERLPGAYAAIATYLKLLIAPYPLYMSYGMKTFDYNNGLVIAGMLLVLTGLFIALFHNRKDAMFSFGAVWFLAALLPVLNLIPAEVYMSLNWLYVPSMGYFLIIGLAVRTAFSSRYLKPFAAVIILILIAVSGTLAHIENRNWSDPIQLYRRNIRFNPFVKAPYVGLSDAYIRKGRIDEAISLCSEALRVIPSFAQGHHRCANALVKKNDLESAIEHYQQAIEIRPDFYVAHNNLANTYSRKGDFDAAAKHYREAIRINPHYTHAYVNYGNLKSRRKEFKEALRQYKIALAIDPENVNALNHAGVIYAEMGDIDRAYELLLRALEINPNDDAVRANLYRVKAIRDDRAGS